MKSAMQVPFVDLKTQYKSLKTSIDARIQKVLDHGAFINGPEVTELEKVLASFVGVKHALACSSGTDALQIPMMALGIGPGDEVITTAFSFIATAETIHLVGATPVYVDIDPRTFNIDPREVEKAITSKTKAILPVGLYGQMANMEALNQIAKKQGLFVIEDAAQSFGATQNGKRSCSPCHIGGTSFFPAKPLGCYGDGGAIFTNDDALALAMKEIREHGSEKRYYHTRLGVNGRLDTLQCAILLSKMERYPWEIEKRNQVAHRYNEAFSKIQKPGFSFPQVEANNVSVWAQYTLTVENRDAFQKFLQENGVPTSVHYPHIMPDQPWYKKQNPKLPHKLDHARWAAQHVVSLPMYPDMDDKTQQYVIDVCLKALQT